MISVGDLAPAITATTDRGVPFSLAGLRGHPVVLFFYPKAGSLGCTLEAKGFAREYDRLRAGGVDVVGVSVDPVDAETRFAQACDLPYPLVADPSGEIARAYGVFGRFGVARRVTFFLGPDGRVEEIVEGMLPGQHLRRTVARYLEAGASGEGARP
jgi:thioredoxin-dependent peroxiredoxin